MTEKHSPGPWRWIDSGTDHDILQDAAGNDVAICAGSPLPEDGDAKLIAEAPEMFRLLMMSGAKSCGWWKGQRCRLPGQCFDHGRIALFKRLGVPARLVRL
jgi:hypothetical protein